MTISNHFVQGIWSLVLQIVQDFCDVSGEIILEGRNSFGKCEGSNSCVMSLESLIVGSQERSLVFGDTLYFVYQRMRKNDPFLRLFQNERTIRILCILLVNLKTNTYSPFKQWKHILDLLHPWWTELYCPRSASRSAMMISMTCEWDQSNSSEKMHRI